MITGSVDLGQPSLFHELRDLKTLLVDDDAWIRNAMRLVFENEACALTVFETAEEALQMLETSKYDIVICDYRLPGMDGIECLRKVKEKYPNALRILITAYSNVKVIRSALEAGVEEIVEKPFTTDALEETLSPLLARRKKRKIEARDGP